MTRKLSSEERGCSAIQCYKEAIMKYFSDFYGKIDIDGLDDDCNDCLAVYTEAVKRFLDNKQEE